MIQGQGHEVKHYGTMWIILSQGINVQYESPITSGKKGIAKFKVFQR